MGAPPHDIDALRARLASGGGPALWRSLDALADTPAFRQFVQSEFPAAARLADGPDRRQFIRLMAASFAMAGLAACAPEDGRTKEVPYIRNPERIEPGAALFYASGFLLDGIANGITVNTRNGRPIKIEGNGQHPWSRGGTDAFAQASILELYDPGRSQAVRYLNRPSTWDAFRGMMTGQFAALRANRGEGLRVLTGPLTSPSLIAQVSAMLAAFPAAQWHMHAPVDRRGVYEATTRVFGHRLEPRFAFDKARVVVSIGGDFLDPGPHQIGLSRAFVDARQAAASEGRLLELHAASSTPNLTSAKSDSHVALDVVSLAALPHDLRAEIDTPGSQAGSDPRSNWIRTAAAALRDARGAGLVVAGAAEPVATQDAVHRLNAALGNLGQTVTFIPNLYPDLQPVEPLVEAMRTGQVSAVAMLGCNPVYTTPASLGFADALGRVKLKIHAGLYVDETALHADWHLPLAHPLESWGDARSPDGTVTLLQPTIAPLYNGQSLPEIVSILSDAEPKDGLTLLKAHWQGSGDAAAFEPTWRQALIDGFMPGTAFQAEAVTPLPPGPTPSAPPPGGTGLQLLFRPDPTVWDGSLAFNNWLQELPKPLTKIVWDNPIAVSPALAEREKLANGDLVTIEVGGQSLEGGVWILPGQAADVVTLFMGYGRSIEDTSAGELGYNAFLVQSADGSRGRNGATLTKTGKSRRFATTQDHSTMEGHDFVRVQPVGAPPFPDRDPSKQPSLYPPEGQKPKRDDGRAWGMVIDTDTCIGCNACVIACQSENNIPVVGREQVALGREMHWLRIDRYYSGLKSGSGLDDPDTHFQPVPCMHCEDAPCEVGCPVEATLHDHEGLNLMVYNRCVGTRACSGYCPYKVRHFNYLDYRELAPSLAARRNPEVTVRAKGVMEKCTYCVQRIAEARIVSDKSGLPIPDGAVQTACQGACPTRAITFGDLDDKSSAVLAARDDARNYPLLGELNTLPRTTYLAERAPPTQAAAPQGKG